VIILGIDPGSLITGYGFIRGEGNRLLMMEAGTIRLKKQGDMAYRLLHLADFLDNKIAEVKPDVISIEKVFHGVNFNSTLALGYVRGVVLMTAARHQLTIAEYSPTQVKKTITGYGRAEKTQMQEMVRMLLNLREVPKPADVADALALAICHAHTGPIMTRYRET